MSDKPDPKEVQAALDLIQVQFGVVNNIVEAIRNEGPSPSRHKSIMQRHRDEWPTLWAALDELMALREAKDI